MLLREGEDDYSKHPTTIGEEYQEVKVVGESVPEPVHVAGWTRFNRRFNGESLP